MASSIRLSTSSKLFKYLGRLRRRIRIGREKDSKKLITGYWRREVGPAACEPPILAGTGRGRLSPGNVDATQIQEPWLSISGHIRPDFQNVVFIVYGFLSSLRARGGQPTGLRLLIGGLKSIVTNNFYWYYVCISKTVRLLVTVLNLGK